VKILSSDRWPLKLFVPDALLQQLLLLLSIVLVGRNGASSNLRLSGLIAAAFAVPSKETC
jgi:hypothetical protein